MKRSTVFALAILTATLVFSASINSVSSADYSKIGVKNGDTGIYSMSGGPEGATLTGTARTIFFNITGTLVWMNLTITFSNGTTMPTITSAGYVDTGESEGGFLPLFIFLLAANLTAGDCMVNNTEATGWNINETIPMIVAGVNRTVNHCSFMGGAWDLYFDKATGISVKANVQVDDAPVTWMNWTMTSTSLWSGGLPVTTIVLIGVGVGAVIVVAAVYFIKVRHK
jgi:hypothetical protein